MRIIAKRTLREFWERHADSKEALSLWYSEVNSAHWRNFQDIRRWYPSASWVGNHRVVFNVKGNNYRIITRINFEYQLCWIRFIGTHSDYDAVDAKTI